jgi:hypothetical protein
MRTVKKILAAAEFQMYVGNKVRVITKITFSFLAPKILSISDYSTYSIILNSVAVTQSVSMLGSPSVVLRSGDQIMPILGLLLHGILVSMLLLFVFAKVFTPLSSVLLAANINCLFFIAGSLLMYKAKALNQNIQIIKNEIFLLISSSVLLILWVWHGSRDFAGFFYLESTVMLLFGSVYCVTAFRSSKIRPSIKLVPLRRYLPAIYAIGLNGIFDVTVWRLMPLHALNQSTDSVREIAAYNLGLQIGNSISLVPQSILESWMSRFAKSFSDNGGVGLMRELKQIETRYQVLVLFLGIAAAVVVPIAVYLIYPQYSTQVHNIAYLAIAKVLSTAIDLYGVAMYCSNKENLMLIPSTVSGVVLLILCSLPGLGLLDVIHMFVFSKLVAMLLAFYIYKLKAYVV